MTTTRIAEYRAFCRAFAQSARSTALLFVALLAFAVSATTAAKVQKTPATHTTTTATYTTAAPVYKPISHHSIHHSIAPVAILPNSAAPYTTTRSAALFIPTAIPHQSNTQPNAIDAPLRVADSAVNPNAAPTPNQLTGEFANINLHYAYDNLIVGHSAITVSIQAPSGGNFSIAESEWTIFRRFANNSGVLGAATSITISRPDGVLSLTSDNVGVVNNVSFIRRFSGRARYSIQVSVRVRNDDSSAVSGFESLGLLDYQQPSITRLSLEGRTDFLVTVGSVFRVIHEDKNGILGQGFNNNGTGTRYHFIYFGAGLTVSNDADRGQFASPCATGVSNLVTKPFTPYNLSGGNISREVSSVGYTVTAEDFNALQTNPHICFTAGSGGESGSPFWRDTLSQLPVIGPDYPVVITAIVPDIFIDGSFAHGEVLTARPQVITNPTYLWERSYDGGKSFVSLAVGATYTVDRNDFTEAFLPAQIKLVATGEGGGSNERIIIYVPPSDFALSGNVAIGGGTRNIGGILTADVSGLTIPSGVSVLRYSYQWLRNSIANSDVFSEITDRTPQNSAYTIALEDAIGAHSTPPESPMVQLAVFPIVEFGTGGGRFTAAVAISSEAVVVEADYQFDGLVLGSSQVRVSLRTNLDLSGYDYRWRGRKIAQNGATSNEVQANTTPSLASRALTAPFNFRQEGSSAAFWIDTDSPGRHELFLEVSQGGERFSTPPLILERPGTVDIFVDGQPNFIAAPSYGIRVALEDLNGVAGVQQNTDIYLALTDVNDCTSGVKREISWTPTNGAVRAESPSADSYRMTPEDIALLDANPYICVSPRYDNSDNGGSADELGFADILTRDTRTWLYDKNADVRIISVIAPTVGVRGFSLGNIAETETNFTKPAGLEPIWSWINPDTGAVNSLGSVGLSISDAFLSTIVAAVGHALDSPLQLIVKQPIGQLPDAPFTIYFITATITYTPPLPSGAVVIDGGGDDGLLAVGDEVTANISGLAAGSVSSVYQWYRNTADNGFVGISGATNPTYTVTDEDDNIGAPPFLRVSVLLLGDSLGGAQYVGAAKQIAISGLAIDGYYDYDALIVGGSETDFSGAHSTVSVIITATANLAPDAALRYEWEIRHLSGGGEEYTVTVSTAIPELALKGEAGGDGRDSGGAFSRAADSNEVIKAFAVSGGDRAPAPGDIEVRQAGRVSLSVVGRTDFVVAAGSVFDVYLIDQNGIRRDHPQVSQSFNFADNDSCNSSSILPNKDWTPSSTGTVAVLESALVLTDTHITELRTGVRNICTRTPSFHDSLDYDTASSNDSPATNASTEDVVIADIAINGVVADGEILTAAISGFVPAPDSIEWVVKAVTRNRGTIDLPPGNGFTYQIDASVLTADDLPLLSPLQIEVRAPLARVPSRDLTVFARGSYVYPPASTGTIGISGDGGVVLAVGDVISVDVSDLADDLSDAIFTYRWDLKIGNGAFSSIGSATSAIYVVSADDANNGNVGEARQIRLVLTYGPNPLRGFTHRPTSPPLNIQVAQFNVAVEYLNDTHLNAYLGEAFTLPADNNLGNYAGGTFGYASEIEARVTRTAAPGATFARYEWQTESGGVVRTFPVIATSGIVRFALSGASGGGRQPNRGGDPGAFVYGAGPQYLELFAVAEDGSRSGSGRVNLQVPGSVEWDVRGLDGADIVRNALSWKEGDNIRAIYTDPNGIHYNNNQEFRLNIGLRNRRTPCDGGARAGRPTRSPIQFNPNTATREFTGSNQYVISADDIAALSAETPYACLQSYEFDMQQNGFRDSFSRVSNGNRSRGRNDNDGDSGRVYILPVAGVYIGIEDDKPFTYGNTIIVYATGDVELTQVTFLGSTDNFAGNSRSFGSIMGTKEARLEITEDRFPRSFGERAVRAVATTKSGGANPERYLGPSSYCGIAGERCPEDRLYRAPLPTAELLIQRTSADTRARNSFTPVLLNDPVYSEGNNPVLSIDTFTFKWKNADGSDLPSEVSPTDKSIDLHDYLLANPSTQPTVVVEIAITDEQGEVYLLTSHNTITTSLAVAQLAGTVADNEVIRANTFKMQAPLTYTWEGSRDNFANFVALPSATGDRYTVNAFDFTPYEGGLAAVRVRVRDANGLEESATLSAAGAILPPLSIVMEEDPDVLFGFTIALAPDSPYLPYEDAINTVSRYYALQNDTDNTVLDSETIGDASPILLNASADAVSSPRFQVAGVLVVTLEGTQISVRTSPVALRYLAATIVGDFQHNAVVTASLVTPPSQETQDKVTPINYIWEGSKGGAYVHLSSGAGADTYTINENDFPAGGEAALLRLAIRENRSGDLRTAARTSIQYSDSGGDIVAGVGGEFTAGMTLFGVLSLGRLGSSNVDYDDYNFRWERSINSGADFAAIPSATARNYVLSGQDFVGLPSGTAAQLRVIVIANSGGTAITSPAQIGALAVVQFAGEISPTTPLILGDAASPSLFTTLTIDNINVSFGDGETLAEYQWAVTIGDVAMILTTATPELPLIGDKAAAAFASFADAGTEATIQVFAVSDSGVEIAGPQQGYINVTGGLLPNRVRDGVTVETPTTIEQDDQMQIYLFDANGIPSQNLIGEIYIGLTDVADCTSGTLRTFVNPSPATGDAAGLWNTGAVAVSVNSGDVVYTITGEDVAILGVSPSYCMRVRDSSSNAGFRDSFNRDTSNLPANSTSSPNLLLPANVPNVTMSLSGDFAFGTSVTVVGVGSFTPSRVAFFGSLDNFVTLTTILKANSSDVPSYDVIVLARDSFSYVGDSFAVLRAVVEGTATRGDTITLTTQVQATVTIYPPLTVGINKLSDEEYVAVLSDPNYPTAHVNYEWQNHEGDSLPSGIVTTNSTINVRDYLRGNSDAELTLRVLAKYSGETGDALETTSGNVTASLQLAELSGVLAAEGVITVSHILGENVTYTWQGSRNNFANFVDLTATTSDEYTVNVFDFAPHKGGNAEVRVMVQNADGNTASAVLRATGFILPRTVAFQLFEVPTAVRGYVVEIAESSPYKQYPDALEVAQYDWHTYGTGLSPPAGAGDRFTYGENLFTSSSRVDILARILVYIEDRTFLTFETPRQPLRYVEVNILGEFQDGATVTGNFLPAPVTAAIDAVSPVNYIWEGRKDNNANYVTLASGADLASYTIDAASFPIGDDAAQIRFSFEENVRGNNRIIATSPALTYSSTGAGVTVALSGDFITAMTLSAIVSEGPLGAKVEGGYTYRWERSIDGGENFTPIADETSEEYAVDSADFVGLTSVTLAQVRVVAATGGTDFTSDARLYTQSLLGDIAATLQYDALIVAAAGAHSNVSVIVSNPPALGTISYVWELERNGEETPTIPITTSELGLLDTYFTPADDVQYLLQASLVITDLFGGIAQTLNVATISIHQPGSVALFAGGGDNQVIEGSKIRATLYDLNGVAEGDYTIRWTIGGNERDGIEWDYSPAALTTTAVTPDYTLDAADITALESDGQIAFQISLADASEEGFVDSLGDINSGLDSQINNVTAVGLLSVSVVITNNITLAAQFNRPESTAIYEWQEGTGGADFDALFNATLRLYTPPGPEVSYNSQYGPSVRVQITYNYGGIAITTIHSDPFRVVGVAITTGFGIAGDSVSVGGEYSGSGLLDPFGRPITPSLLTYSWFRVNAEGGAGVALDNGDQATYILSADTFDNDTQYIQLRVTDRSKLLTGTLNSPLISLNSPAAGEAEIIVVGDGAAEDGGTLTLQANITDANGDGALSGHSWLDVDGDSVGTASSDGTELVLNADGVSVLAAGDPISLTFTHTDDLGFTTPYAVSFNQLAVAVTAILNAENDRIDVNVDDTDSISTGAGDYTYQWRQSATKGGAYNDIADDATNSVYIVTDGYDITKPYIRVEVGYTLTLDDSRAIVSSPGIRAIGVSGGNVTSTGGGYNEGATRTAEISGILDLFGRAVESNYVTYQWQVSDLADGTYTNVGVDSPIYTLSAADFIDNDARYLRVSVGSNVTGDTFAGAVSAGEDIQRPGSGNIVINTSGGFENGNSLSLDDDTLTDANDSPGTAIVLEDIIWESVNGDTFTQIATVATYAIDRAHWATSDNAPSMLRARATYTDAFGGQTNVTAAVVEINQPATGQPEVILIGAVTVDSTLQLQANIADENGNGALSGHSWTDVDGGSVGSASSDGTELVLNEDGANVLTAEESINLTFTHTDDLGFTTPYTVSFKQVAVAVTAILNAENDRIDVTVDDTNTISTGEGDYNYQWRQSATEGGAYNDIAVAATSSAYIVPGDYDISKPYIRVEVSYQLTLDGTRATASSPGIRAIGVSGGNATSSTGGGYNEGATRTADISGILDLFGRAVGSDYVTYQWQVSDSQDSGYTPISGATLKIYTLSAANFSGSGVRYLRVAVGSNVTGDTYAGTASAGEDIQRPGSGNIVINTSGGFADGDSLSLDDTLTDANDLPGAAIALDVIWESNGSGDTFTQIATGATYTIDDAHWATSNNAPSMLRARATYTDAFGGQTNVTAAVVEINQPATGQPQVILIGAAAVDSTLQLQPNIADENGDGALSGHNWTGSGGSVGTESSDGTELVLNANGVSILKAGGVISLTFTHTDDLGFTTPYTVLFRQLEVLVGIVSNQRQVQGSVNDTNNTSTGNYDYKWQQSASENSGYENISGAEAAIVNSTATLVTYPVPSDYDTSKPYIRVAVGYQLTLDDSRATVSSPGIRAIGVSGGNVSSTGGGYNEGATRTAVISGILDLFGGSVTSDYLTYQWQVSDSQDSGYTSISGATSQTYTLSAADFSGSGVRYLRVAVGSNITGDTYAGTVSAGEDIQRSGGGNIAINTSGGFADGDSLSLNNNLTDANSQGAIVLEDIIWESNGSGDTFTQIATGATYIIDDAHWAISNNEPSRLRVRATYTDSFGGQMNVTTAVVGINQRTSAALVVEVDGGGEAVEGATVVVNISGERDGNGTTTDKGYLWSGGRAVTEQEYILTEAEAELLVAGNLTLAVIVTFTDGLEFTQTFTATLSQDEFDEERAQEVLGVLDVAALGEAVNVIGKHLSQVSSGRLGGGGEPQTYLEINSVEVDSADDITRAFAARAGDSLQKDEMFRLDEFKVAYSGTDKSGASWSSWAQVGWSQLSGSPTTDDKVLKYDGKNVGVFVGVDREFGDSIRAGVAVGLNKTDIDLDIDGIDGVMDDNIIRELNSVLPYLEWSGADSRGSLLFLGGYGLGDLELKYGNCRSNLDVDWLMGSVQGNYNMPVSESWDVRFNGGINGSRSNLDGGRCDGATTDNLPGGDSTAGEGSLGVETGWTSHLLSGGTFRPYLSLGARVAYGDLENDAAYDMGGGFNVALPLAGVSFGIDGKRQINNTTHNRDSISGVWALDYGAYESSFKTTYNISDSDGRFVHRWESNRVSEWGVNTLNSGIYIQRSTGDKTTDSVGLHIKMEWK